VLGPAATPIGDDLRRAGIPVRHLPVRHVIDFRGMRALKQTVAAAAPAVVHAWGPEAARATRLLAARTDGGNVPRVVVSAAAVPGEGWHGWLTTRRLRRADRVVPASWAEGERYRRLGIPGEHLTRVAPGVAPAPPPPPRDEFLRALGLPQAARLIVTAGRIEASPGLKAAIWAFDLLRYEFPDLHLLIFGTGPDRVGLEDFGRALAFDDFRVHFPGCRADLPAVLGLAEAVWVTRDGGGVTLALEAMAAGRPVVGWKTPDLAEVVDEDATGFLVPPGDRAQVAARTHGLLTDPALAAKLGAAARARAAERFGAGRVVEQHARLYAELVS
jgi:glycosyltransferase involved in cell wall biosynthesis